MNSDNCLLDLYEQWRVLTERERAAIHQSEWGKVAELQAKKRRLQEEIMLAGEHSHEHVDPQSIDTTLRRVGDELILLERQNAEALSEKRRALEQQKKNLDQTSRNLQQVHRAYAQGREPAWQSYS